MREPRLWLVGYGNWRRCEKFLGGSHPLRLGASAEQSPSPTTTLAGVEVIDPNHTHLRLDAEGTLLSPPASTEVVIAVGIDRLADDVFLHEPPTPVELERGIDVIEDALMETGLSHFSRGDLAISDAHLLVLFGGEGGSSRVRLAEVEAQFQRMAAVSLGSPLRSADPAFTRSASAALLILRECMHHLGYSAVWVASDNDGEGAG